MVEEFLGFLVFAVLVYIIVKKMKLVPKAKETFKKIKERLK